MWKYKITLFTHADGNRVGKVFASVCLSVCLVFRTISQNRRRITEPDAETFHDKSLKLTYFGSKGEISRLRVIKALQAWVFALL